MASSMGRSACVLLVALSSGGLAQNLAIQKNVEVPSAVPSFSNQNTAKPQAAAEATLVEAKNDERETPKELERVASSPTGTAKPDHPVASHMEVDPHAPEKREPKILDNKPKKAEADNKDSLDMKLDKLGITRSELLAKVKEVGADKNGNFNLSPIVSNLIRSKKEGKTEGYAEREKARLNEEMKRMAIARQEASRSARAEALEKQANAQDDHKHSDGSGVSRETQMNELQKQRFARMAYLPDSRAHVVNGRL